MTAMSVIDGDGHVIESNDGIYDFIEGRERGPISGMAKRARLRGLGRYRTVHAQGLPKRGCMARDERAEDSAPERDASC